MLVPDLTERTSNFFTRTTGLKWQDGNALVEFSQWQSSDCLILTLRGYVEGKTPFRGGGVDFLQPRSSLWFRVSGGKLI